MLTAPQSIEQAISDSGDEAAQDHWRTRTGSARHPTTSNVRHDESASERQESEPGLDLLHRAK
jgi:hypothetical protein